MCGHCKYVITYVICCLTLPFSRRRHNLTAKCRLSYWNFSTTTRRVLFHLHEKGLGRAALTRRPKYSACILLPVKTYLVFSQNWHVDLTILCVFWLQYFSFLWVKTYLETPESQKLALKLILNASCTLIYPTTTRGVFPKLTHRPVHSVVSSGCN